MKFSFLHSLTLKVIDKVIYFKPNFRYKSTSSSLFKISLGGSGLNTARILVSLGEKSLQFFGAIGSDKNGKLVRKIVKDSGVAAWYEFILMFL